MDLDLIEELGVDGDISVDTLTLYIPDRDKEGIEIGNQRWWVLEGAKLLATSFRASLSTLRRFLHALGRQTRQGEVAFEFKGRFYRITEFDASSTWEEQNG